MESDLSTIKSTKYFENSIQNNERIQVSSSETNLLELSNKVAECTPSEIIINSESIFNGSKRQDLKGVELLMWLRVKHKLRCPIILYGFLSSQQILAKEPKYLIIYAPGNSYMQLPFPESELEEEIKRVDANCEKIKFKELNDNEFRTLYKPFLKPTFNIEEFRHREANWWGIKCLWDVYNIYIKNNTDFEYKRELQDKLKQIESLVAIFLYDNKYGIVAKMEELISLISGVQLKIEKLLKQIEEDKFNRDYNNLEIGDLETDLKNLKISIDSCETIDCRKNLERQYHEILNKCDSSKVINSSLDIKLAQEESDTHLLDKKISDKKRLIEDIINIEELKKAPYDITDKVSRKKILVIDDQSQNGWIEIYSFIFYGNLSSENIKAVKSEEQLELSDSCTLLKGETFLPDLILLDLRLNPSEDNEFPRNFERLSGARLLSKIRSKHKGIPILMTTASNKIWSYEELMKLGADAYWMKEGIDNNFSAEETIQNYSKLIWLIEKFTNIKYQTLSEFSEWIETFNYSAAWWNRSNNNKWKSGQLIDGNPTEIKKILDESLYSIRSYLKSFEILKPKNAEVSDSFFVSSILNKFGVVIEAIHSFSQTHLKEFYLRDYIDKYRGDTNGADIYNLRNDVSHRNYVEKATWDILLQDINKIKEYLNFPPTNISVWKGKEYDPYEEDKYRKVRGIHSKSKRTKDKISSTKINRKESQKFDRNPQNTIQEVKRPKKILDITKSKSGKSFCFYLDSDETIYIDTLRLRQNTIDSISNRLKNESISFNNNSDFETQVFAKLNDNRNSNKNQEIK